MGDLHVLKPKNDKDNPEEPEIILYTVHYKRVGWFGWRKIKNVVGDGYVVGVPCATRYFALTDGTRLEFPAMGFIFTFSPKRMELVERNLKENKAKE